MSEGCCEPIKVREALIEEIPPSSNHLYRNGPHGRRIKTREGEAFENRTKAILGRAWARSAPLDPNEPYCVQFTYYLPDLFNAGFEGGKAESRFKRKDVSNLRKLIEDVTAKVLGVDDSATLDAISSKRLGKRPLVLIEVWQLPRSSCYGEHSEL